MSASYVQLSLVCSQKLEFQAHREILVLQKPMDVYFNTILRHRLKFLYFIRLPGYFHDVAELPAIFYVSILP